MRNRDRKPMEKALKRLRELARLLAPIAGLMAAGAVITAALRYPEANWQGTIAIVAVAGGLFFLGKQPKPVQNPKPEQKEPEHECDEVHSAGHRG